MFDWFTPTSLVWPEETLTFISLHMCGWGDTWENVSMCNICNVSPPPTQPWCLSRGSRSCSQPLSSPQSDLQRSPFTAGLLQLPLWRFLCSATTDVQNSAVVKRKDSLRDGGEMMSYWNSEFLQVLQVNIDEAADVPAAMQLRSPSAAAGAALPSWPITAPWLNPEHIKHQVNTNHLEGRWEVSKWL